MVSRVRSRRIVLRSLVVARGRVIALAGVKGLGALVRFLDRHEPFDYQTFSDRLSRSWTEPSIRRLFESLVKLRAVVAVEEDSSDE